MSRTQTLVLAILAGAVLAPAASHAQAQSPAFLIAEVEVSDPAEYKDYAEQVPAIAAKFGGHYIVRGGKTDPVEGAKPDGNIVVIEFPSLAQAEAFEASPEYNKIRPMRQAAATSRIYLVEGLAPK